MTTPTPASPPGEAKAQRQRIAEIIDPIAFDQPGHTGGVFQSVSYLTALQNEALGKADEIIALCASPPSPPTTQGDQSSQMDTQANASQGPSSPGAGPLPMPSVSPTPSQPSTVEMARKWVKENMSGVYRWDHPGAEQALVDSLAALLSAREVTPQVREELVEASLEALLDAMKVDNEKKGAFGGPFPRKEYREGLKGYGVVIADAIIAAGWRKCQG